MGVRGLEKSFAREINYYQFLALCAFIQYCNPIYDFDLTRSSQNAAVGANIFTSGLQY